jgi:hypothetical protein
LCYIMKENLEILVGSIAVIGTLWQIARGYQSIYDAIDKQNNLVVQRIVELEKSFLVAEAQNYEKLKRIENMIELLDMYRVS